MESKTNSNVLPEGNKENCTTVTSGLYGKNIELLKLPATPHPMYNTAVRIGPSRRSKSAMKMC